MAVNTNLNTQGSAPGGAYIQPSPGYVIQATTDVDVNGLLQQSVVSPTSGFSYFGVANYRDAIATVQAGSKAAAPSAGGTVVSITPGTVGFWEITGLLGITGTTVTGTDTNNFQLLANGSTLISTITYPVQSTTGNNTPGPFGPVVVNVTGTANTVQVQAAGNSTGSSVYSATLVARRVG